MKRAGKRLLTIALILCLLLAALPEAALAEETKPEWKSVGDGAEEIMEVAEISEMPAEMPETLPNGEAPETPEMLETSEVEAVLNPDGAAQPAVAMSGYCGADGSNIAWALNGSVLTLTGSGAMANYAQDNRPPWYAYCASIRTINIDGRISSIGDYAFSGCMLAGINLPSALRAIGTAAFSYCSNLLSVRIPDGVEIIKSDTFSGCTGLQNIKIPYSVYWIQSYAFSGNRSLQEVHIPASVRVIGSAALTSARRAYFYGGVPQTPYTNFVANLPFNRHGTTLYYIPNTPPWVSPRFAPWECNVDPVIDIRFQTQEFTPVFSGTPRTVAVSGTPGARNATISWSAVNKAISYIIYRSLSASNDFRVVGTTTKTTYTDGGLSPTTDYFYKVQAQYEDAKLLLYGEQSDTLHIRTSAPTLAVPTINVVRNIAANVGFVWNRIPDATGYSVYRGVGTDALVWYSSSANPWYSDMKALPGATYSYQVMPYAVTENSTVYGPCSRAVSVTVPALGAPALNLAYAQINHTGLTWNAISGATGYSIYRGTPNSALGWYASSTNPWFVDNATRPGITYSYQVMAYRSGTPAVYGAKSAVKTATIPAIATPSVTVARTTPGNVGLTWNGITGATGYSVYRGASPSAMSWYRGTTNPWLSDANTAAGTTYYYQVLTYLQTPEGNWYSAKSAPAAVYTR